MSITLPATPSHARTRSPAADPAEVLIQQQCARLAHETEPDIRKAVLLGAAMELGKDKAVALDVAGPALLAAARARQGAGAGNGHTGPANATTAGRGNRSHRAGPERTPDGAGPGARARGTGAGSGGRRRTSGD